MDSLASAKEFVLRKGLMMFKYVHGDIFQSSCEAIVNPVNCVGVMGSGLALAFKERFPENFDAYKEVCRTKELRIGKTHWFALDPSGSLKWIINFPTKGEWKENSKIAYIRFTLLHLKKMIILRKLNSIAIPKLGCGKGNLSWGEVKPIIEEGLQGLDHVTIEIYE